MMFARFMCVHSGANVATCGAASVAQLYIYISLCHNLTLFAIIIIIIVTSIVYVCSKDRYISFTLQCTHSISI